MKTEELNQKLNVLVSKANDITRQLNAVYVDIRLVKYEIWCNERGVKMGDTITLKDGRMVKLCGFENIWAKAYVIRKDGTCGRMITVFDSDFSKPIVANL